MPNFHRLLRKTKAVISPGKKENETRDEYRKRYQKWWFDNCFDKSAMDLSELEVTGLFTEETYLNAVEEESKLRETANKLLNELEDTKTLLKGDGPSENGIYSVTEDTDGAQTGRLSAFEENKSNVKKSSLSGFTDGTTNLVLDAGDYEVHPTPPRKLGAGSCGTKFSPGKTK